MSLNSINYYNMIIAPDQNPASPMEIKIKSLKEMAEEHEDRLGSKCH
jgi:hypothetical protein